MAEIERRLAEMGLKLPVVGGGKPHALPARRFGDLLFVSGHGPHRDGKAVFVGRVGSDLTLEEGVEAAKLCALNCLAAIKQTIGDLDNVEGIINTLGFVNSAPDFHDQPTVMNGFSDLFIQLYGERGTRSAIGTSNLPKNQAVEVQMVVAIRDDA